MGCNSIGKLKTTDANDFGTIGLLKAIVTILAPTGLETMKCKRKITGKQRNIYNIYELC